MSAYAPSWSTNSATWTPPLLNWTATIKCEDCRRPIGIAASPGGDNNHKQEKVPPKYTMDEYEELKNKRRSLRLLNLFPSSPENPYIECELVVKEIDPDTKTVDITYEALSWCWGDSTQKQAYINIRKGGRIYAKYVSPNLVAALRTLRNESQDRYVWIDAVCINQEDLLEKNHQVR